GGTANNYSFVTNKGSLTVNKAMLTVTAEDKVKGFSQENPELTMTFTGFVKGDDESVLDAKPTASTTADKTTPAGNVAITLTGGSDNNYAFNLVNGVMTILSNSVITAVTVPSAATYAIGDQLSFEVNFSLPVSITGTPVLPLSIGTENKVASLTSVVSNSSKATFSYTVEEGDLDPDGIALGTEIDLNGGAIKDEFGTNALLNLNQVTLTTAILVDGIAPTATLSTAVGTLTNAKFEINITFDETVSGFTASDIQVTNGTASNLVEIISGQAWTVVITPGSDGTVTVGLPAEVVTDTPGNPNIASNPLTTVFDATAPKAVSLERKDSNPLLGQSASFRAIFTEEVTGVDLTDFEVILTGTVSGLLNTVTQVDAKTYDISLKGIAGEGTIGLNLKNDQS
ncbi:MBG domain-containing protein, partial [Roseivirga echinicomitans]